MEIQELGSCQAILSSISTKVDGSLKISIEINPDQKQLISNLMAIFASSDRSLFASFVKEVEKW